MPRIKIYKFRNEDHSRCDCCGNIKGGIIPRTLFKEVLKPKETFDLTNGKRLVVYSKQYAREFAVDKNCVVSVQSILNKYKEI